MDQPAHQRSLLLAERNNHQVHTRAESSSLIDETAILESIFQDLDPHSLLRAALACKLFKDHALDILWSSLDSLLPLFKLLRPFGPYAFRGPFDESEWPTFDMYARRVKKLSLANSNDGEKIAYTTIEQLSRRRPYFFPNLRVLTCRSVLPLRTPLFSLMSPTLEYLELGGDQAAYDEVITPAVFTLFLECEVSGSNLKQLTLHGSPPTLLSGSLSQFSSLSRLFITIPVSFGFFESIGKLDNLEDLTVVLPGSSDLPLLGFGFRALRTLDITCALLPLHEILAMILTPHLKTIRFSIIHVQAHNIAVLLKGKKKKKVIRRPANEIFQECFRSLNSRWKLSLQSIILNRHETSHSTLVSLWLDPFPLLCFDRLDYLQFHHTNFCYEDSEIQSLALACPNLKTLYLSLDPQVSSISPMPEEGAAIENVKEIGAYQPKKFATIASLWSLAELCPKLTYLQIRVNTDTIPPFLDSNIHAHGLAHLSITVYSSPNPGPTHIFEIARHIYRLFPDVTIDHNPGTPKDLGYAMDLCKSVAGDVETRMQRQHAQNNRSVNFLSQ